MEFGKGNYCGSTLAYALEDAAETAHKIFQLMGWTWHLGETKPTKDDLADTYKDLYNDVKGHTEEGIHYCAAGRLCVTKRMYNGYGDYEFGIETSSYLPRIDKED